MGKLSFSTIQETETYLASIVNYEWVLPGDRPERAFKLERAQEAMDLLGIPHQPMPAIHVGGTKGKGSTVLMMEAILEANRQKTVTFMSPHVSTIRERIRISGKLISEPQWVQGFNAIAPILEEMTNRGRRLTYFEVTWLLALQQFQLHKPDAMLIEVGMGGRLDCTNLITPRVAVLTPISHDHTRILGKRISQIAWDKSHILKPNVPAIIAQQNRWANAEISKRSQKIGIEPLWFGKDYELIESMSDEKEGILFDVRIGDQWYRDLRLSLLGSHQRYNATVALVAVDCFLKTMGQKLNIEATRKALAHLKILGRLEWGHRNPDVLLDVAHNPASFKALVRVLQYVGEGRKIHAIVGFSKGKDSRKCLKILAPHVNDIILVPTGTPRSQDPAKLLKITREIGIQSQVSESGVDVLQHLMRKSKKDLILVTGSFPLVGDCRNFLMSPLLL
jgi:dihydrofolate synthase/folylpolyglutamate synthase